LISYNYEGNIKSSKSQWNVSSNNFAFETCDHRKEMVLQQQSVRREDAVLTLMTLLHPIRMRSASFAGNCRISGFPLEILNFFNWLCMSPLDPSAERNLSEGGKSKT